MVVGESKELFHVHKDIFCAISPFFKAALSHDFQEAADQTISLPEDDGETFDRLTQWIYTRDFSLPSVDTKEEVIKRYLGLARLFVLADKLQIMSLRNHTISIIYQILRDPEWLPSAEVVLYICSNTRRNCGLRRLLVACYVWKCDPDWFDKDECASYLQEVGEFAVDLAIGFAQRINHPKTLNPFSSLNGNAVASFCRDEHHMEGANNRSSKDMKKENSKP